MKSRIWISWLLLCLCDEITFLLGAGTVRREPISEAGQVNEDTRLLKDFSDRVQAYVKLHKRLEASLPPLKPTPDPAKIVSHQQALAKKIQAARQDAKPGSIFTPDITERFLRLIRNEFQGPNASHARATLRQGEPVKIRLGVNAGYPKGVPLTTVPPTLLLNLPRLPPEVEYRIVDHELILRDIKANLIVDIIPKAIP